MGKKLYSVNVGDLCYSHTKFHNKVHYLIRFCDLECHIQCSWCLFSCGNMCVLLKTILPRPSLHSEWLHVILELSWIQSNIFEHYERVNALLACGICVDWVELGTICQQVLADTTVYNAGRLICCTVDWTVLFNLELWILNCVSWYSHLVWAL